MTDFKSDYLDLRLGDCMEGMKEFPDNHFDLAIVDPPYGIERFQKGSGATRFKGHKMMQEEGLTWDKKPQDSFWEELFRVSKNQIIWGANNFRLPTTEYFCIWDKMQSVPNFASAEYAWVSPSMKTPAKVFRYNIHAHNTTKKIHPTQKPVKLYKWLLKNYAEPGMKILDTHLGSMSIAIACHDYQCHLTGFEIDEDYYKAGIKRVQNHVNQLQLFR